MVATEEENPRRRSCQGRGAGVARHHESWGSLMSPDRAPPPPVAQPPLTADPRVSVSCLPGPQTARSSPPPGSSFSSQFSSQLEGCLFCDLPVCCPGTPTGSLGFSLWPLVAQSSHGSTLMKTANLKTAITIPSLTQCPGSPSFLQ